MNRLLGYEPYRGFKIYAFTRKGKDIAGRPFSGFVGYAKREEDSKCIDGYVVHRTIADAEDEMKSAINMTLSLKQTKSDRPVTQ